MTVFRQFPTLNAVLPWSIARGPRGELWYTLQFNRDQVGRLVRLALDGTQTEYHLSHTSPGVQSLVGGLTTGPDGAIWFPELADDIIGRLVPP